MLLFNHKILSNSEKKSNLHFNHKNRRVFGCFQVVFLKKKTDKNAFFCQQGSSFCQPWYSYIINHAKYLPKMRSESITKLHNFQFYLYKSNR